MNKNDEKKSIIIGIATFGFVIAIAIISISFFASKSHAQVLNDKFSKNATYAFNQFDSKSVKTDVKYDWSQSDWDKNKEFKQADFVKVFDAFGYKEKTDKHVDMFKPENKAFLSFTFPKADDSGKFSWGQKLAVYKKVNFQGDFNFETKL